MPKISELTAAAALTGTEVLGGVQGGGSVKITTQAIADLASGGISNIVEDTTPQLGANLDVNSFDIVGAPAATATSSGGGIDLRGAAGGATSGNGGAVEMYAGAGGGGSAGNGAYLILDSGRSSGSGGYVELAAGSSNGQAGQNIEMAGGDGTTGGSFRFLPGRALSAGQNSGNFEIEFRPGGVGGESGKFILQRIGTQPTGWAPTMQFQGQDGGIVELTIPGGNFATRTWTLPDDDPSVVDGQFMTTDSSGNLSFAAANDLGEYTVATLPAASSNANRWALATDASGGRTIVRSDGTNWKVVAVEGATVST